MPLAGPTRLERSASWVWRNVVPVLVTSLTATLIGGFLDRVPTVKWKWPKSVLLDNRIIWSLTVVRSEKFNTPNFVAASTGAIYVPDKGGYLWEEKVFEGSDAPIITLSADSHGTVVGGTLNGDVFFSYDHGDHWLRVKVSTFPVTSIVVRKDHRTLLVATFGDGLFEVRGSYSTRIPMGTADRSVWCLWGGEGQSLVSATLKGTYSSSDGGSTWKQRSDPTIATACAGVTGHDQLFLMKDSSGALFLTQDGGKTSREIVFADGGALNVWSLSSDVAGDFIIGAKGGAYFLNGSARKAVFRHISLRQICYWVPSLYFGGLAGSTSSLWAQSLPRPMETLKLGPAGPTLLPSFATPIGNHTNAAINSNEPKTAISPNPRLPESVVDKPSQGGGTQSGSISPTVRGGGSAAPAEQSGSPGSDLAKPPSNPPPSAPPQTPRGLICEANGNGSSNCRPNEVAEYLKSVLQAKEIAEVVAKLLAVGIVAPEGILIVAVEKAEEKTIETLMEEIVKRMTEQALENVRGLANGNGTTLGDAVRAHEAYVRRVKDAAIRESIRNRSHRDSRSESGTRSQMELNTSGPAMHQLSYSATRGIQSLVP